MFEISSWKCHLELSRPRSDLRTLKKVALLLGPGNIICNTCLNLHSRVTHHTRAESSDILPWNEKRLELQPRNWNWDCGSYVEWSSWIMYGVKAATNWTERKEWVKQRKMETMKHSGEKNEPYQQTNMLRVVWIQFLALVLGELWLRFLHLGLERDPDLWNTWSHFWLK